MNNAGTYWRFALSSDWLGKTPWSINGRPVPYIGSLSSTNGSTKIRALGPLALISVTVGEED